MGLIYGKYGGRSDAFAPGGASFETGFCPHGGMCHNHLALPGMFLTLRLLCLLSGIRRIQSCQ